MTYPDSWATLNAPLRGLTMASRHLPPVELTHRETSAASRRQLQRGQLRRLRHGVAGPPADVAGGPAAAAEREHLLHAAALAATSSRSLVFARTTAALLIGCWVTRPGLPVHAIQRGHVSAAGRRDPHVRRHCESLDDAEIRRHDDVLVTSIELTVVDCARMLPERAGIVLTDSALRLGADRRRIEQILELKSGARGIRGARRVVEAADGRPESPGESSVRAFAECEGLGRPVCQFEVETYLGVRWLDLAWPELRVAVEFDGALKYRGDPDVAMRRLQNDEARHDALRDAGWLVIRVRWGDLTNESRLRARLRALVIEHKAII